MAVFSHEEWCNDQDCDPLEDNPCGQCQAAWEAAVAQNSASTNSAMDAILALYKRWEATTPKVQHVWGAQEFIQWAQEQHQ